VDKGLQFSRGKHNLLVQRIGCRDASFQAREQCRLVESRATVKTIDERRTVLSAARATKEFLVIVCQEDYREDGK
jgi:hypothetical protein